MKHTPGPWQYSRREEKRFSQATGKLDSTWVWHEVRSSVMPLVSILQTEAINNENAPDDARLIAAAPEMLEALEYASSALENLGIHDSALRMTIEAAIAKARGA